MTRPQHYPQLFHSNHPIPKLNPNGIPASSPGLARGTSAYPGLVAFVCSTPTGLRQTPIFPSGQNPVGVHRIRTPPHPG